MNILWVFIFIPFVGTLAGSVVKAAVAFQSRSLGALGWQVGALTSGFMVARALSSPFFGYLTDRFSPGSPGRNQFQRRNILLGLVLFILTSAVFPFTREVWLYVLLRTLQGLGAGMLWTTMQTYVAESAGEAPAGKRLAFYFTSGEMGRSLGYLLYGLFFTAFFPGAIGTAIAFFLLTAWSSRYLPSPAPAPTPGGSTASLSTSSLSHLPVHLYLAGFSAGLGVGLTSELLLIYLKEIQGLTVSQTTTLLFVTGLLGQAFTLYLSHQTDKGNVEAGLRLSLILAGWGSLLLTLRGGFLTAFPALLLLLSGLYSFAPISRAYSVRRYKNSATVIGFLNTAGNLGGFLSPLLGGYLYEFFLHTTAGVFSLSSTPYLLLGVLLLILGVFLSPISPRRRNKK